ncbi:MAG TPA: electron transfer flavoprotein subunit beta/FixA family protein [Bacteroidales bacterium]|nr:electron transfer flavoprotein subunit beta/FixA family protein [Bacteroidales bacterium]
MKILVCISNVPDTTTKIKFVPDFSQLDATGIQWVINPWDELSLTRALELKDDPASGVTAVSVAHVGTVGSEPTIRKALAIGADDAFRVNAEPSDAFFVALQLAEVVRNNPFDLILCGIESSDYNGSTVGGMLAEFLGIPSVSAVSSVGVENGHILLNREIDGGKEQVQVPVPLVAVVQKGIAREPRIASMRGIMTARTKPIRVSEPVAGDPLTGVVRFEMPKPRAACKFVDAENPKQLVELLQNEAKVI